MLPEFVLALVICCLPLRSFRGTVLQIDEPAADAAGCNRTYWALMAMRLTPRLGFSAFGGNIVRAPILNGALSLIYTTPPPRKTTIGHR